MSGGGAKGLSGVPLPALALLLEGVERGRVGCPLSEASLRSSGFGAAARPILEALGGLGAEAVGAAVRLVTAERVNRPPPHLRLVWTGPESRESVARDTALAVRELFEGAQREVIVAGYAFDRPDILAPLHAAMRDRGVAATLFLDIEGTAQAVSGADVHAAARIDRFFRSVWTFGVPKPEVYYDPRTAMPGPPWASLHAKCVVVDDARALLTSANFTDRGQSRNIEAGVWIEDRAFAEELSGQLRALVAAGLVTRYRG